MKLKTTLLFMAIIFIALAIPGWIAKIMLLIGVAVAYVATNKQISPSSRKNTLDNRGVKPTHPLGSKPKPLEGKVAASERLTGDELIKRRANLLRNYSEQDVARLCGYYLDLGNGNERIDMVAYLKEISKALTPIRVGRESNRKLSQVEPTSATTKTANTQSTATNRLVVNDEGEIEIPGWLMEMISASEGDQYKISIGRTSISLDYIVKSKEITCEEANEEINYNALWEYFEAGGGDIWNEKQTIYLGTIDAGPEGGDIIEVNGPNEYGIDCCRDRNDLPRIVNDFLRYGGTYTSIKKALKTKEITCEEANEEINYNALWEYFEAGGGDIWNEKQTIYLGTIDAGPEGGDIIEVNGPNEYGIDCCRDRNDLPRIVNDFLRYGGTYTSIKKALKTKEITCEEANEEINYNALWEYFEAGGGDIWNEKQTIYLGTIDAGPEGGDIIEVNGPNEYGIDCCRDRNDLPRIVNDFLRYGGTYTSIKKALKTIDCDNAEVATSPPLGNTQSYVGKGSVLITVIETGGEFTGGTVDDPEEVNEILRKINDGSMVSYFDLEDGGYIEISNYNNIFGIYGPHVPGSTLRIEVSEKSDGSYEDLIEGQLSYSGSNTGASIFQSSNPWPRIEEKMMVFNKKIEKRIHYSVLMKNVDLRSFDAGNIYVGYMNMDESFGSADEILEFILYIAPDDMASYYKEHYGEDADSDISGSELLCDIFDSVGDSQLAKDIVRRHSLSCLEVEGKGEWECDYIKVSQDDSWNVLYESGDY